MAGADQYESVMVTDKEHRFGGAEGVDHVHIFTYNVFEHWVKTYWERKSMHAECGAMFRPTYMGVMTVDQKVCPDCMQYCTELVEKKVLDPIQPD